MKILIPSMLVLTAFLSGCGVSTSDNVSVDSDDLRYVYDHRTNMCYAVVASRPAIKIDTSGLGLANVDCTKEVMQLVEK